MFGTEGSLDMIRKKVSRTKVKAKTESKVKIKKVSKKYTTKVKNPVYLKFQDEIKIVYGKHRDLNMLLNNFVNIHSNEGILYGFLSTEDSWAATSLSYYYMESLGRKFMETVNKLIYTVTINFHQMPNRDDISLIAETDDYLGDNLFWNEHDEFKKDSFKKSTDYEFILGNVDKIDVENNRVYVKRLKQIRSKKG